MACALANDAFALFRLASKGAGSIRNKTWPSLTFDPSSNNRFSRIPVARARTWASRTELIRPGNSVVRWTRSGVTVNTETSGGGGAGGVAPCLHALRSAASDNMKTQSDLFETIEFICVGKVRRLGIPRPQMK